MSALADFELKEESESLLLMWPERTQYQRCLDLKEFKEEFNLSERAMVPLFNKSKSEIHRMLSITKLQPELCCTIQNNDVDYHTICFIAELPFSQKREELISMVMKGEIKRHLDAKKFMNLPEKKKKKTKKQKAHLCSNCRSRF